MNTHDTLCKKIKKYTITSNVLAFLSEAWLFATLFSAPALIDADINKSVRVILSIILIGGVILTFTLTGIFAEMTNNYKEKLKRDNLTGVMMLEEGL